MSIVPRYLLFRWGEQHKCHTGGNLRLLAFKAWDCWLAGFRVKPGLTRLVVFPAASINLAMRLRNRRAAEMPEADARRVPDTGGILSLRLPFTARGAAHLAGCIA
jgi:hypothetical protein